MFVLDEEVISVTSGLADRTTTATFPLRTISPDYAVGGLKFNAGVVVMLLAAVGFAALTLFLFRLEDPWSSLSLYSAMFAVFAIVGGIRLIPRLDFLIFADHWKRPLFSIARERGQSEECDAFVAELLNRIERTQLEPGHPDKSRDEPVAEGIDAKPEWLWKMAIICGGVTLGFPLAAHSIKELSIAILMIVLAGSTGALGATLYSYSRKERRRHWCLVGVALAGATFIIFS